MQTFKKYRWFLFFPLFVQLIKHFQLDAHFVEEAGGSAMDQVDQVVDLGSEEEETEVKENQCSGGAHEDDGDDDCGGDGDDDSVNAEVMEIISINDDLESFRFFLRLKCLFSGLILLDQYVRKESESWVIGQVISLLTAKNS